MVKGDWSGGCGIGRKEKREKSGVEVGQKRGTSGAKAVGKRDGSGRKWGGSREDGGSETEDGGWKIEDGRWSVAKRCKCCITRLHMWGKWEMGAESGPGKHAEF